MQTYEEASTFLGTKTDRPIEYATRIVRIDSEIIGVKQHSTIIVKYYKSGAIEVQTGGYHTPTTKDRLNRYTPLRIWQKNRVWYVNGEDKLFADGMVVEPSGVLTNYIPNNPGSEKKSNALKKAAKLYATDYVVALFAGKVPAPSNGDCWYCLMHTNDGRSLGEATKNSEHIMEHIKEKYFVPSLMANAAKRFPLSPAAESVLAEKWQGISGGWSDSSLKGVLAEQLTKVLYRYILEQIGFAS